jgi:hypothetical protein
LILNHLKKLTRAFSSFFDFSHYSLHTWAPDVYGNKKKEIGATLFYAHISLLALTLLAKKRFGLKSNSRYFDLKSHLDHESCP